MIHDRNYSSYLVDKYIYDACRDVRSSDRRTRRNGSLGRFGENAASCSHNSVSFLGRDASDAGRKLCLLDGLVPCALHLELDPDTGQI